MVRDALGVGGLQGKKWGLTSGRRAKKGPTKAKSTNLNIMSGACIVASRWRITGDFCYAAALSLVTGDVEMTIKPGTQSGDNLMMRNRGAPQLTFEGSRGRGDQIIVIRCGGHPINVSFHDDGCPVTQSFNLSLHVLKLSQGANPGGNHCAAEGSSPRVC